MGEYRIDTLRGKEVVISGDFRAGFGKRKAELAELARRAGARRVGYDVRKTTEVFVKGQSERYKYNSFGDREAELAARVPRAIVIGGEEFFALLARKPVEGLAPRPAPPS